MKELKELARLAEEECPGEWRADYDKRYKIWSVDFGPNSGRGSVYDGGEEATARYLEAVQPKNILELISKLKRDNPETEVSRVIEERDRAQAQVQLLKKSINDAISALGGFINLGVTDRPEFTLDLEDE